MANAILVIMMGQSNALGVKYKSYSQGQLDAMVGNYSDFLSLEGDPSGKYEVGTHKNIKIWNAQNPDGEEVTKAIPTLPQVSPRQFTDYTPLANVIDQESNPDNHVYGGELPFALRLRDELGVKIYVVKVAVGGVSLLNTGNSLKQQFDPALSDELYDYAVDEVTAAKAAIDTIGDTITHTVFLWDQGESDQTADVATYKSKFLIVESGIKTASGASTMSTIIRKNFLGAATVRVAHQELADENASITTLDYIGVSNKRNYLAPVPINPVDEIHIMPKGLDYIGEEIADYYLENIYV